MALGSRIRLILGDRLSRKVGGWYRAIFADIVLEASIIAEELPPGAHVLDVGGGDGVPLGKLLELRPDITAVTIDPAAVVGQWIEAIHDHRVTRMPGTSIAKYLEQEPRLPTVVLLCDVMHHVEPQLRAPFVRDLLRVLRASPGCKLIVKDVEPGHFRALLGYWADVYVTGDKTVRPIGRKEMISLFASQQAPIISREIRLFELDCPNYALVLEPGEPK